MTNQPGTVKRAVVFGATGLVGKELISTLLGNSDFERIIAVVRKQLVLTNPRFKQIQISDFSKLMGLKEKLKADVNFCCIGTTIKTAGSREAFLKVDFEIPEKIAQLAETNSIPTLVIISSMGADARSSNFYLRTKGEMEKTVREIYSGNLKFVRPSLLIGNREEFRFGEKVAIVFMKALGWIFAGPLKKYRAINASEVARIMIKISQLAADKLVFESDELQDLK